MALSWHLAAARPAAAVDLLYGSSDAGDLFIVNVQTGAGRRIGRLPNSTTEIECDPATNPPACFLQLPDGAFQVQPFALSSGAALGDPVFDGFSFTGLEFVGGVLYGTAISSSHGPSSLRILHPATGASDLIGATGVGPISGLAYDVVMHVMYGIAGGGPPANLYTIDLSTGLATVVGNTGLNAGSLQFGPDGNLYAGTTGNNGGDIYRIDPSTGASTLVGSTGFPTVTGLTLAPPLPAPAPALSDAGLIAVAVALALIALCRLRSRSA